MTLNPATLCLVPKIVAGSHYITAIHLVVLGETHFLLERAKLSPSEIKDGERL